MNLPACGRAAGKVILLGEHAVVYGRPALAAGLRLELAVEVEDGTGSPRMESDRVDLAIDMRPSALVARAAATLGLDADDLVVRIRSDIPPGVGLGSSAALTVAVLRALAEASGRRLGPSEEFELGRRLETIFHGRPSGIDPAAAALGTCFRFVRGDPPMITPLRTSRPLPLVIAFGERRRNTIAAVAALRTRWEAERARYERLFDDIEKVVEAGAAAAQQGDLRALGLAFDQNQGLLRELGVSAPDIEKLVVIAQRAGALGAKLTGAGMGGAVVALATDPERVAATWRAAGAQTIVAQVGAVQESAA